MTPFTFAPQSFASDFRDKGYVYVKDGVNPELLRFAREQLAKTRVSGQNEIAAREIKNRKKQYLFDLPTTDDFLPELADALCALAELPRAAMTLSERHIMVYDDHASAVPPLHKDRLATQIAVGIPLEVHSDARIVLLPHSARAINPLDSAIYCARSSDPSTASVHRWNLADADHPEPEVDWNPTPVELDVQVGDVVIFAGSSMYHGRLNAAASAVLYFKFNALRLDPLGEDPSTDVQRQKTLTILEHKSDGDLLWSAVELSPRLQRVSRHYTRLDWTTVLQAYVSGEREFTITEADLRLLFEMRKQCTLRRALLRADIAEEQLVANVPRVRRLGRLGAVDFLS